VAPIMSHDMNLNTQSVSGRMTKQEMMMVGQFPDAQFHSLPPMIPVWRLMPWDIFHRPACQYGPCNFAIHHTNYHL
jgi:hypothetical protein